MTDKCFKLIRILCPLFLVIGMMGCQNANNGNNKKQSDSTATEIQTPSSVNFDDDTHLKFKGVPIDGSLKDFVKNMQSVGFQYLGTENDIAALEGDFAGYKNCTVLAAAVQPVNVVNKIVVLFPRRPEWGPLYDNYQQFKSFLTQKYGKSTNCVEKFEGYSQPQNDRDKFSELILGHCKFITDFETSKGEIKLSINNSFNSGQCVTLTYWDKINTDAVDQQALKDL